MYRIELAPGEVTVFRTIEELAIGVRNDVIGPRARIYHSASQKWLPIEFHPHYKLALELPAGRTIEMPAPKATDGPRFDNIATPSAPSTPSTRGPNLPYIVLDEAQAPEEPMAPPAASPPAAMPHVSPPPTMTPPSAHSAYAPPAQEAPHKIAAEHVATKHVATEHLTSDHFATDHFATDHFATDHLATEKFAPAKVAPAEVAAESLALPWVVASPVLELPKISYPEFTPAEEPVAESGSATSRGRRPLHVGGAVLVLVLGAYAARSAFSPARGVTAAAETPAPTMADRPVVPQADSEGPAGAAPSASATSTPTAAPTAAPSPKIRAPSPAPVPTAAAPASSGFAPALEPRAIVSGPAPKPVATAPVADSVQPITPAPIELDLSVPALLGSESLVTTPSQRSDSAMKRILKAVVGGKEPVPQH